MPLYSIITPTFNSAKTITVAMESLLNQSFPDFEVLIIDGLSTDNTLKLAKSFNDHRIKIYSEKDEGVYDAMNKGINLAKGQWLFFLGSDDRLYSKNILGEVLNTIKLEKADVIYGDSYSQRFNGRYDGMFTREKILNKNICHQSIFFEKKVFQKIGCFDLKYKVLADWDYNLRWILNAEIRNTYVDLIVSEYADGGLSSTQSDEVFRGEKVLKYLLYGRRTIRIKTKLTLLFRELKRTALTDNRNFHKLLFSISRILFVIPRPRACRRH